ncbi:hypothetical protein EV2_018993 [Malus domestica]
MGQITRVTVPLNLAFAVVAEFDDLTLVVSLMAMELKEALTSMDCSLILLWPMILFLQMAELSEPLGIMSTLIFSMLFHTYYIYKVDLDFFRMRDE